MDRFGEKLHTLRTQRDLSMRQLAPLLEIKAYSYISKLENNEKKPSVEFVIKVARFFGVSADKLLMDELDVD
ncbi:helix-turn-helix transcriptional regulator [Anaerolineales bacterium HSG6]|nr:helix-turn-helix transcriptional regulator [Anaerolineales bacterium HSG6]